MIKIVADSGSDILVLQNVPFVNVPLKITTEEREFTDDINADREEMLAYLKSYNGKSGTACPSIGEWLDAFGDSEEIFCVALTSKLSGSYNSACVARERYLEMHPDRKVTVIDTLSAGPGMGAIVKKLEDLVLKGKSYEEIKEQKDEIVKNTRLFFTMKSLKNMAANGRVKPSVAVLASVLGICLVCTEKNGMVEPIKKARGEKNSIREMYHFIKGGGYNGGRILIDHCNNEAGANTLKETILKDFPIAEVIISKTRLLCSFYVEDGGILVGF